MPSEYFHNALLFLITLIISNLGKHLLHLHSKYFCVYFALLTPCRTMGFGYAQSTSNWYGMRKARGRDKLAYYENVFIARQDISEVQVEDLTESFTKVINDNDGKIVKSESWGLRTLAYRIKKNRKGHYVMLNIDAPAGAIHEMERQTRINEDILRYLTIKIDAIEEGPSVMMNSRSSDDRPRQHNNNYSSQTSAASAPEEATLSTEEKEAPAQETASDISEDNAQGTII
jgi:small subunit ribosomal protein S6